MKIKILWIGRGRLARHLIPDWQRTLTASHDILTWDRSQPESELLRLLPTAQIIALAISDRALETFHAQYRNHAPRARWIHFSGALELEGMTGYHPLMTFGPELYTEATYRRINYVTSSTETRWPTELPLPNALFAIHPEQKALYHALCVLSGNFTTLLWAKAQSEFAKLGLPAEILRPYADVTIDNVFNDPTRARTGPLVRGDVETMNKNLEALGGDPFAGIYRAFQKAVEAP
ncbi:MAG: DUF2520 domain-containing protein [Bdellovibrionaceae bacterium]|nr:DUF2520 domain-containing protein [Pseudobdellovibrionaceae bacterium]